MMSILQNNLRAKYINCDGKQISSEKINSDRIKASEDLRRDINFEDDPFKMLDMSLLCIAFLTGDTTFYEINRAKLIKIINTWHIKNNKSI